MRSLIVGVALTVLAGIAHAEEYKVVMTPEQNQALERLAARKTGPKPETVTPQQLVQRIVDAYVAETVSTLKRDAACAKMTDDQLKQFLGCPK